MKKGKKLNVYNIAMVGVMAAIICIFGPLSIPIGVVPISLTVITVFFAIYILGRSLGTISYLIYLLIGLIGLPVFSGFSCGPAKLFGPTGGYLIGFIFMAEISGLFIDHFQKWYMNLIGMLLGLTVCYAFGTVWLSIQAGMSIQAALAVAVFPFLLGDMIKIMIVLITGPFIKKHTHKLKGNSINI